MQAQITKEDGIIIIRLHGISDVESVADLRSGLQKILSFKRRLFLILADLNFCGIQWAGQTNGDVISTLKLYFSN